MRSKAASLAPRFTGGAGVELCLWSAGPRAVTSEAVPLSGWEPASLLPVRSSLVERVAQPM